MLSTSGCATIVEGSSQRIDVATDPSAASCTIQKEGLTVGVIQSTPGSVEVSKTRHDLTVACDKPGYQKTEVVNASDFAAWTLGDVALTSTLGVLIDWSSGAINKYDGEMKVALQPQQSPQLLSSLPAPQATRQATALPPAPASPPVQLAAVQPVAYQPRPAAPVQPVVNATGAHRVFGVGVAPVDPDSTPAQTLGLDFGMRVMIVQAGSVAAQSGIVAGDILVSLDGEPINRKGDIQRVVASRAEGSIVSVHLVRNGAPMDLATQL